MSNCLNSKKTIFFGSVGGKNSSSAVLLESREKIIYLSAIEEKWQLGMWVEKGKREKKNLAKLNRTGSKTNHHQSIGDLELVSTVSAFSCAK